MGNRLLKTKKSDSKERLLEVEKLYYYQIVHLSGSANAKVVKRGKLHKTYVAALEEGNMYFVLNLKSDRDYTVQIVEKRGVDNLANC